MRLDDYLRVSEAAKLLRVTPQTIRKYYKNGLLEGVETPGRQIIYTRTSIEKLLRTNDNNPENTHMEEKTRHVAFYVRSSDGDTKKINNQIDSLTEQYGKPDYVYSDKASGLNENRKGLNRLIDDARSGKINVVYFTQKDRLTRFGYSYLERLFNEYDCKLEPVFAKPDKTLQEELLSDFMTLIASFSGKYYRMRGYEQKKKLLEKANAQIDDKVVVNGK